MSYTSSWKERKNNHDVKSLLTATEEGDSKIRKRLWCRLASFPDNIPSFYSHQIKIQNNHWWLIKCSHEGNHRSAHKSIEKAYARKLFQMILSGNIHSLQLFWARSNFIVVNSRQAFKSMSRLHKRWALRFKLSA